MASLEHYLEALLSLKTRTALESLNPGFDRRTEFQFGYVSGIQAGLQMAEELLNKQLSEEDEDGTDSRSPKARRTR
jgi:hypothetical protein